jgi:hypothetical protein
MNDARRQVSCYSSPALIYQLKNARETSECMNRRKVKKCARRQVSAFTPLAGDRKKTERKPEKVVRATTLSWR